MHGLLKKYKKYKKKIIAGKNNPNSTRKYNNYKTLKA